MPNDTLPEAVVEEIARAVAPVRHQYMAVDLMLARSLAPIIARLTSEARQAGVQQGLEEAAVICDELGSHLTAALIRRRKLGGDDGTD